MLQVEGCPGSTGQSQQYLAWSVQARLAGVLRNEDEDSVRERERTIRNEGVCESDDPHILALAQISGARLLYTNDRALQRDFGKSELIASPKFPLISN